MTGLPYRTLVKIYVIVMLALILASVLMEWRVGG